MHSSGHFVDFFNSDEEFVASAADFLYQGFGAGCSCIAVLTRKHLDGIRHALAASGVDSQQLIDDYRFVSVDADETLRNYWANGHPDTCGFYNKFAELIRLMSAGGREVRIIGEMVSLLARRGQLDAVIQVEELCNALSREQVFKMYCLYCEHTFATPLDTAGRRRICAAHSGSLRAA
jgi:KaiC/GvpD/RAD55 family RecA-like ATPase